MQNKIILYYQTFIGLKNIYNKPKIYTTHIHLSSLHFGPNKNNEPYIHLNNLSPYDKKFDDVWNDLYECKKRGIKIVLMLGGAGGLQLYVYR